MGSRTVAEQQRKRVLRPHSDCEPWMAGDEPVYGTRPPKAIYPVFLFKITGFGTWPQNSADCLVIHDCGDFNFNQTIPI